MTAWEETDRARPGVVTALNDYLRKADADAIEYVRKMTNADVSGHKPDHLQILDDLLDEDLRKAVLRRNEVVSASLMFGAYLGEVFVRNLRARWRFPGFWRALAIRLSLNPFVGEHHFYLMVANEKVYVFAAAREAIMRTGGHFSLREFYEKYATPYSTA